MTFQTAKSTLKTLLERRENRTNALDVYNQPFQIGAYKNDFGLLIVTAYRDGLPIQGSDGLILSELQALNWIMDASETETQVFDRNSHETIYGTNRTEFIR